MKKLETTNPDQVNPQTNRKGPGPLSFRPAPTVRPGLATEMLLMVGVLAASAANVTLKTNDALGTSSVTGSTNWSNGQVPASGNTYFTTNASGLGLQMRTPTGLANNTFPGDALVLCTI